MKQVRRQIKTQRTQLQQFLLENEALSTMRNNAPYVDWPPSLQYGVDMLCCIRQSAEEDKALPKTLFENHLDSIPVNATIGMGPIEEVIRQITKYRQRGFDTFKIKIGKDFRRDIKGLTVIRDRFPAVSLRIDVNEQWTYQDAVEKLNKLKPLRIEYCEQPLERHNWEGMSKLTQVSPVPIAADETIADTDTLYRAINMKIASYYIVKPMRMGSITKLVAACRHARSKGCTIIFSSLLESGWGRLMNAALASGIDTGNRSHGLATGTLFSHDLLNQAHFTDGNQFILPPDGQSIRNLLQQINFEHLTAVI